MINSSSDGLLSVQQAAGYLGVSEFTIYTWVSKRRIPFIKVGRRTMFRRESLDRQFKEVAPRAA